MSVESGHDWTRPPAGGYTAEDLDRLPDLPPHTELIDGSLVFVSPQTNFHMLAVRLIEYGLLRTVPREFEVIREMNVVLGEQQRPEPDVMVVRAEAMTGNRQTAYRAEDVILAVEVVSPESRDRDRETKPLKYARAGVEHFWRVEEGGDGFPAVYVYELDPATRCYAGAGVHHARLKLAVPFPVDIDLTSLRRPV
ncbi:Endonuclease, Uma2 family (restriction endonuclease fold) [Streptomyces aidingensis]|uniref:Endonuclease, Uma2 family (Restriction endonuclease fold) n=2 Tax=Streptomyces aidingensis TaxID=910347 RepID=A0A1I1EHE7_9ACTN|nr:Endonuclease, Uma2 family (restriction endonuclease fold) [Streptomyces aidingensis]